MKILFTADWHIRLGQKNVPVSWAKDRYHKFFDLIYNIEDKYELHIIGGDIFDRLPSMEELELYFEFIAKTNCHTIIYDGNHEATKRGKTFLSRLKAVTHKLSRGKVLIVDYDYSTAQFSILPYCMLHAKKLPEFPQNRLLFTHVRGSIPPHVIPEVNLDIFNEFKLVIAGDLHAHSNSQRNIVYPGAPMTIGFHRNSVKTGYIEIDTDNLEWNWKELELPQLIRKTVTTEKEMIATNYDHTIYELEGSLASLARVKNSELLDKKVIKRKSEAALILDPALTVPEELREYLLWILELDDKFVDKVIGTFNDYYKEARVE